MKCFIVFSMKRSGHHAIIRWISEQISGHINLFNNCEIIDNKIIPDVIKIYRNGEEIIDNQYHYKNSDLLVDAADYDASFFTFEDKPFDNYIKFLKNTCHNIGTLHHIIVARDFYNNSASRFATRFRYTDETKKIWINHIHRFDNILVTGINFNKWFENKNYRNNLTKKLGISFTDAGLNDVHGYGSSTFDDRKYDGNAQQMDVLNRWKKFQHDNNYWKEISPEIKSICKKYFDMELN